MEEQQVARNYELAVRYMRSGLLDQAIAYLRQILAHDPEDALAHALLSACLLDAKRIHAALHEAQLAVGLAPDRAFARSALGRTLIAHRKLKEAEAELQQARTLEPEDEDTLLALAMLYGLQDRKAEQLAMIEQARALAPDSVDAICAAGGFELERGEVEKARALAHDALTISPEDRDALVLMGSVYLREGKVEDAREHAIWALQSDASDTSALRLLAMIKARTSLWLGLWFRYNTWVVERGTNGAVLVLVGMYVFYRLADQLLADAGQRGLAELLSYCWLGICIYTWVGPQVFQRALAKELETVRLREDF